MGDQESTVEKPKAPLQNQARTFEYSLSKIEASREQTGRLKQGSAGGDQHAEGAGAGARAGSASGHRDEGANINSELQSIGLVEVARGSSLALRSRKIGRIKTVVPTLGCREDFLHELDVLSFGFVE